MIFDSSPKCVYNGGTEEYWCADNVKTSVFLRKVKFVTDGFAPEE